MEHIFSTRRAVARAVAIAVAAAMASRGRAAIIWDGSALDGNWQTTTNWTGNKLPTSAQVAEFDGTGTYNSSTAATIDAHGSFSISELEFASTANGTTPPISLNNSLNGTITLTGTTGLFVQAKQTNPVTINTNLSLSPTTGTTTTFNITEATTVNGIISGGATLLDTGSAALTLAGQNTYAGGTSVNGVTLLLGASSTITNGIIASGPIGAGAVTFATGSTLKDNGTPISIANAISLGGAVTFATAGGGSLTIDGTTLTAPTGVTLTAAMTATVGNTTTINSIIGDSGNAYALSKAGTGTLILNGANTYSGGTSLSAGTLQLGASSTIANGIITNDPVGTGTLALAGGTLKDNGTALTLANAVSLNGTVTFAGTGSFTIDPTGLTTPTNVTLLGATTTKVNNTTTFNSAIGDGGNVYSLTKTGTGTLVLGGANTFSGGVNLSAGTLQLGGSSTISSGLIASGPLGAGTLALASGTTIQDNKTAITIANPVSLGGGTITFGGPGGSLIIDGNGLTSPTAVTLAASTTLNVTDTTTINSPIGDGGNGYSLTKTGAAALKLSGVNTYSGTTTIDQNNIQVAANAPSGSAGALGNSTTPIQVGDATTPHTAGAGLVTTGNFTVGRDISVYNISANPGYTSGAITLGGATSQTGSSSTFSGNVTLNGPANFQSDTNGSHVVDFNAIINGPGALNKVGAGTVQLDNANDSYSGGTNITAGTLLVNGSATGGGAVAVTAGALGGIGSLYTGVGANGLTVSNGASIVPGLLASGPTSGTSLSIFGDVTINGVLSIEADSNTSQLNTSGALTLGANSSLVFTGNASGLSNLAYVIATYGASGLTGTFGSITNEPAGYTIDYDYLGNNDIALIDPAPAPEPATTGLFGFAAVGILISRRRPRRV